jgi:hypothetical protein
MDRVFETVEIRRQMVVKTRPAVSENQTPIPKKAYEIGAFLGGDEGTRTPDPLLAKQVLYQLSYIPIMKADLCRHPSNTLRVTLGGEALLLCHSSTKFILRLRLHLAQLRRRAPHDTRKESHFPQ